MGFGAMDRPRTTEAAEVHGGVGVVCETRLGQGMARQPRQEGSERRRGTGSTNCGSAHWMDGGGKPAAEPLAQQVRRRSRGHNQDAHGGTLQASGGG